MLAALPTAMGRDGTSGAEGVGVLGGGANVELVEPQPARLPTSPPTTLLAASASNEPFRKSRRDQWIAVAGLPAVSSGIIECAPYCIMIAIYQY
jgi:hypothetical protein